MNSLNRDLKNDINSYFNKYNPIFIKKIEEKAKSNISKSITTFNHATTYLVLIK